VILNRCKQTGGHRLGPVLTWLWILAGWGSWSSPSFAVFYHSQFQTADLNPGMSIYEVSLEPNIIFSGPTGTGFGLNGHLQIPLSQDFSGHFAMGTGVIPFMFDGHVQYNVYPDFEGRIAFSLGGGLTYLRQEEWNHVTAYVYPTVSKRFFWGGMILSPYALAPVGIGFYRNRFQIPLKVAIGNKITNEELKNLFFYWEVGVGILNAPIQVSFGMSFMFDSKGS
jgi:hypothetical protein